MAIFFLGGAIGSAVATASFAHGGWPFTAFVGITCAVFALVIYAGEFLGKFFASATMIGRPCRLAGKRLSP